MPQCPVCNSQLVKLSNADGYGCPFCGWRDGVETRSDRIRNRREAGHVPDGTPLCNVKCPTCGDRCIFWKSHSDWRKMATIERLSDEQRAKYPPGTYWLQFHHCIRGDAWRRAQRGYYVIPAKREADAEPT